MNNRRTILLTSASLILLHSATAMAGFIYDESVDGDLTSTLPLPILPFELGSNKVTGKISITNSTPPNVELDTDKFAFLVPGNGRVDSITMVFEDLVGDLLFSGWFLRSGLDPFGQVTSPNFIEARPTIPSPSTTVWSQVPLGPGLYNLATGGISNTPVSSSAYTIEFIIIPIPEPSTLALLAGATLLFALKRNASK